MSTTNDHITTTVPASSEAGPPSIWAGLVYPDPQAAIDLLVRVFGFEPVELVPGPRPGEYAHVELRWPHGSGGVMIGRSEAPEPRGQYVVTPDPDALYARCREAGLEITREIEDTEYGSRTFTVVDPWSVRWNFGTYGGQ